MRRASVIEVPELFTGAARIEDVMQVPTWQSQLRGVHQQSTCLVGYLGNLI
jgi:hypothetical protein